MKRIAFSVGGRPVQWQRTGQHGGTRVFTPHAMRKAKKAVAAAGKSAMGVLDPFAGPVRLTIITVYAVPKTWPASIRQAIAEGATVYKTSVPDLDNLGKLVSDALNGIAYIDDCQVAELVERKRYGDPERTDVIVQELGGSEPGSLPVLTPADKRRKARTDQPALAIPRPAKRTRDLDATPRLL